MAASRVIVQLDELANSCFVVMPFSPLFQAQYDRVIKPAIQQAGLECVRGDEIYAQQAIVQVIWHSMRRSRLVLAELSGRNPNVMYEIGLAHAIGKPIILLTRNEDDVPFDLRALRYIYYDPNNPFWGEDLRAEITRVVRLIIDNPTLAAHLAGVQVEMTLPQAPSGPLSPPLDSPAISADLSGVWFTKWISIVQEREHRATLVIPSDHGDRFAASLTVTYGRLDQQTVVHETLTGTLREGVLSLVGVNYTYVQQGASSSYSLDSFDLRPSRDGKSLIGNAILRRGFRQVTFKRSQEDPAGT